MKTIIDSTVIFHLNYHQTKMNRVILDFGITEMFITRISYGELLAGAGETSKIHMRKVLRQFPIMELDKKAIETTNLLGMRYRVNSHHSKDFFIACIAVAHNMPLLTENNKYFNYKELNLLTYRIAK